ncbi:MAG: DUF58 domain-containing protein [Ktedonobacterales bacterium]
MRLMKSPKREPRTLADESLVRWHRLYLLGALLGIASIVLRQPLLIMAGLLVVVMACVVEIWYRYGLRGMRVWHELDATRVAFGEEAVLRLVLENRKPLPLPFCEIEDESPDSLPVRGLTLNPSSKPERAVLRDTLALWAYQRVRRSYHVHAVARGAFRYGPMTVRTGDPFGLLPREMTLARPISLLVHPLVAPIEKLGLPAHAPFGERPSPRRLLEDPLRFSGIRGYAPGDEPRRIHWKATARTGTLQSKTYESSTRHTLAIFLDVRTFSRLIGGYDPSLVELAISTAASVAVWGAEQRYAVGIFSNGALTSVEHELATGTTTDITMAQRGGASVAQGEGAADEQADDRLAREITRIGAGMYLHLSPSAHADQPVRILDGLARLLPYYGQPMEHVIASEEQRLPFGTTVVYIGAETVVDVPLILALRRLRSHGQAVTLLLTRMGDIGYGAEHALDLADLPMRYIGGRELWAELSGDVLGPDGGRKATNKVPAEERIRAAAETSPRVGAEISADGDAGDTTAKVAKQDEPGEVEHEERGDSGAQQQRKARTRSLLVE